MKLARIRDPRRCGAVAVETAMVILLMTSFVFGIFEYGRLMMDWNLLNNAAREGCRYALVNNTSTTITADVSAVVTKFMVGRSVSFSGFSVTVSGTNEGVATAINNLGPGDPITVTVTGTYKFMNIIPLAKMPTTWSMSSGVTMLCEGGT